MGERERLIDTIRAELERLSREESHDPSTLRGVVAENPIDVADALPEMADEEKQRLFVHLGSELQADVLEEAGERDQELLLDAVRSDEERVSILSEMAPDDVADIVDEVSDTERERLLEGLEAEQAQRIRELAQYDPDTAGGLMTTAFVSVPESATVQQVKNDIRSRDEFESIDNIFVTSGERLMGVFSARQLILAENDDRVADFMTSDVVHVEVDDDREECFRVMETYHLSSLPVVDDHHDLVGIITVDDVLTVGEEEASEDVFRMAGSADLHPTHDSILGRVRKRLPWLVVSIVGGFGAAMVMKLFGMGETKIVGEVTYFLPMIAMLGGNIATQSSAVMVRGFATGEVDARRIGRVILDELLVGIIVGALCAAIASTIAYLLGDANPSRIAFAVLSAVASLAGIASILGTTVPSLFHRLGFDPAISAGPAITGLVDAVSSAIYLSYIVAFHAH